MTEHTLNLAALPRTVELVRTAQGVALRYVDQTKLPYELVIEQTSDWHQVVDAIKVLGIRGAPALGVAGAAALALWVFSQASENIALDEAFLANLDETAQVIATARPTAVNLAWGVNRANARLHERIDRGATVAELADAAFAFTKDMEAEDERVNRAIGANGAALLGPDSSVVTHCNAGSLATVFYGTALGVVYAAAEQGKIKRVYADETRPVGQGARLTTWELAQAGVPVTLQCDNMAASLFAEGGIDAVIVGADRIARNGDTANKIGTLGLAISAHEFGVPFYVAAPLSTVDPTLADGTGIPIEQRAASEVISPSIDGVDVRNPAFDITPARYITRIITEAGIVEPKDLTALLESQAR